MRRTLFALSALSAVIVAWAPLSGALDDHPAPVAKPRGFGIRAQWRADAPTSVFELAFSSRGPTLSMLVAVDHVAISDSRTNEVAAFTGHDWPRVSAFLASRKTDGAPVAIEIAAQTSGKPVPYRALVAAMATARDAGYDDAQLIDEKRILTSMLDASL